MSQKITVKQGDTLIRVASTHGFRSWETIWNDPQNESLREKRSDPQVLYEGDRIVVPEKTLKTLSAASSAAHRFRAKSARCFIRIRLKDQWGEPFKDQPYEFTSGGKEWKGQTDESGVISLAVPPETIDGTLKFWPDPDNSEAFVTCIVKIGYLNPATETTGIQGRLNNLGFSCGDDEGEVGERTTEAIRFFQLSADQENPTGELDDQTRRALVDRHGNI